MKKNHRLIPDWPFPSYLFIPGENVHPKKAGGYMHQRPDPVAEPIDSYSPQDNKFLRYALDLYNSDYFWDSHVYFEALWNAHGRKGSVADFLKGMIKLGAAGVKFQIQQPKNAIEHLERAIELFMSVKEQESAIFLGFDLDELIGRIQSALKTEEWNITVYPIWE